MALGKLVVAIVLTALVAGGLATFLTTTVTRPGAKETVEIVDSAGRLIEIPYQPKTVVLHGDAAELMKAIGVDLNLIVGVSKYMAQDTWLFPVLSKKEVVGSCFSPNYEKIIELQPDIVIAYQRWPGVEELEQHLKPAGIEPVIIDGYKPDKFRSEIMVLGRIYGREEEARKLWEFWEGYLNMLENRVGKLGPEEIPDVYFESWTTWKTTTAANQGWWNRGIEIGGGNNIAALLSSSAYVTVDPEWVVEKNPDVIVKVASYSRSKDNEFCLRETRERILARDELQTVKAVKSGAVYAVDPDIATGPKGIIGALWYAKFFHPELFENLNPTEVQRCYFENFLNVRYSENWCWVYPTTPQPWKD